jgi:hypothetical protein
MQFGNLAVVVVGYTRQGVEDQLVLIVQVASPLSGEIEGDGHGHVASSGRPLPLAFRLPLVLLLEGFPQRRHVSVRKPTPTGQSVNVLGRLGFARNCDNSAGDISSITESQPWMF